MATLRVIPLPDGTSQRENWQTQKSGKRIGTHTKKSAAIRQMNRRASKGDSKFIHGVGGKVQKERTHR